MDLIFSFADLSVKDKAAKAVSRYFERAGANVIEASVDGRTRRTAGISYRELNLTFADSQVITMQIKQSGDIFRVLLNGSPVPIKSQADQRKAVAEIVAAMDANRAKFQKRMALKKVELPKGLKTAAPRMVETLQSQEAELDSKIAVARKTITELEAELAGEAATDSATIDLPKPAQNDHSLRVDRLTINVAEALADIQRVETQQSDLAMDAAGKDDKAAEADRKKGEKADKDGDGVLEDSEIAKEAPEAEGPDKDGESKEKPEDDPKKAPPADKSKDKPEDDETATDSVSLKFFQFRVARATVRDEGDERVYLDSAGSEIGRATREGEALKSWTLAEDALDAAKGNHGAANRKLHEISKRYYPKVPIADILKACTDNGFTPIDDDGEPWEGMLVGRDGNAVIELKDSKYALALQWYRMPSGNYEVNAYVG